MYALIISGPTASGKSALALDIAQEKNGVIINADSLQLYRELPILSSQPSESEKQRVPHLLYGYFKANESCSVAQWMQLLRQNINDVFAQKKLPIIVGGTGMYISKIFEGISKIPQISKENHDESEKVFNEIGRENLRQKLIDLGEKEIADKQRLIRAYEVFLETGKTLSWWQENSKEKLFDDVNFTHINLEPNRDELYEKCNLRFEKMLNEGAIEEVQKLIKSGVNDNWQITKTLGFVEIRDFLENKISRKEMISLGQQKTRNYAKRQYTWFRHQFKDKKVFSNIEEAKVNY